MQHPKNLVVAHDDRVIHVEDWTIWNGEPWKTIDVRRQTDSEVVAEHGEFISKISSPELGGRCLRGTLDDVLVGLHPDVRAQYHALFALEHVTWLTVREAGFQGYRIVGEGNTPTRLDVS